MMTRSNSLLLGVLLASVVAWAAWETRDSWGLRHRARSGRPQAFHRRLLDQHDEQHQLQSPPKV